MSVRGSAEMQARDISEEIADLFNDDDPRRNEQQIHDEYQALLESQAGQQLKKTGAEGAYHWKRQHVNGLWLQGRAGLRDALDTNSELLGRRSVRHIGKALVSLAELEHERPESIESLRDGGDPLPDQWRHHIEPRYILGLNFFDAEEPVGALSGDLGHWLRESVYSEDPEHYMHANPEVHGVSEAGKRAGIIVVSGLANAINSRWAAHKAVA